MEGAVSKMKCVLVLFLVLLAPGVALAQNEAPKWSYIEGGWIDFSPDEGDSGDGWFAGGSMKLFKNFHLVAEYDDINGYTFWDAGGGWHGLLGEKADLFAQVVWSNIKIDEGDVDESGAEVQGGFRWKIIKWFELRGQVNWVDYGGDLGDDTTGEVGALFTFINDRVGVGVDWETGDANTTRAFFRFNFGK
jgi:hypothetical protein